MTDDERLLEVLDELRDRRAIGEASLPDAIAHAEAFVDALPAEAETVIDLGSGGGLPALVIAVRRPQLRIVMTERRERRADLLRLAIAQLGVTDRVLIEANDVQNLGRRAAHRAAYDAVTARAFGESLWTLRCARPFLRSGHARIIVSEPPESDPDLRWPASGLNRLGLQRLSVDVAGVACFGTRGEGLRLVR